MSTRSFPIIEKGAAMRERDARIVWWMVGAIFGFLSISAAIIDILHRRNGYVGIPQMSFVIDGAILISLIVGVLFVVAGEWPFARQNVDHHA